MQLTTLTLLSLSLLTTTNAQACGQIFGKNAAACKAQCSDLGGKCRNIGGLAVLLLQCEC